ncbi:hypothetical protein TRFO_19714 [Tritrichomonas foetus]|uniref:Uncharacterized protein n=1 Tax=Tritrichomonas foetus TaxID=1144522 RepID=A0A1J4KI63_9EUKA|nr:hypothetical protein TRFO_19714 [Tritrichomonas foetus]|eukprot:OHT10907.1 hypothetical protein TRFO_19714 [Tritrichomonas foetus]
MSSGAPRRKKGSKSEDLSYSADDEHAPNNEEEEENAEVETDSTSSQEYEVFDSSPEPKRGKRKRGLPSETTEPETPIRSSARMRRNAKSADLSKLESQTDSDSSSKPKKKLSQTDVDKDEDLSSPPPEIPKRSETKRLMILLEELKSAVIQLECEFDSPSLAAYTIESFLFSGQSGMDSISHCFSSFYEEYKRLLKALSLKSSFNELYEYIRSLEIQSLSLREDDPLLAVITEFVLKIEKVTSPIISLEPLESPMNDIRHLTEITTDTPFAQSVTKVADKLIPICLLLNSLNIANTIVKSIQHTEPFELLSLDIPEYNNIELLPYESSILQTYQPNPYYVNHCLEHVTELENQGIVMTSPEIKSDHNSLVKIVAPNIHNELIQLCNSLKNLSTEGGDDYFNNIANDISHKPISIVQFFLLEKKLSLNRNQDGSNVENQSDALSESLRILKIFRLLHSLFLILDSEKLVSYSNAVHLMYFRTFSSDLAGKDFLVDQPLLSPIDDELLVQIALHTTQRVNPLMIDQRIQLKVWLYLASADIFCVGFEKGGNASEKVDQSNEDDSFDSYYKWFKFLTTLQAETEPRSNIEEEVRNLPPLPEFSEKLYSYLTEDPLDTPTESTVVHLQLIFQAELSDTCINYQSSLINQIRTTSFLKQYSGMLESAIEDNFITVPDGFSMNFDIKSFNEHHWDLTFVDILPFLNNISDLLPPLNEQTIDLHVCFSCIHSGYISYENVAKFGQLALKHRSEFHDPVNFVREIKKLSRFALFLDLHDQLVSAHALASDPPFSMTRNINAQILCRTIANQLLIMNTASVFEPSRSKEIAVEAVLLRLIADAIKPALRLNPKVKERLTNCLTNISTFFDNPAYGLHGLLNQVRINFALNEIEKEDLKEYTKQAIEKFNELETSIRRNQEIIEPYFALQHILEDIKKSYPEEISQCEFIENNLKMITIISQIRETMITAGNCDHPFNCIFPISIKDKMGDNVPVLSSFQALMINKKHFPVPDAPLPLSKQEEMISLLKSLQEEREKLIGEVNALMAMSEKNKLLQKEVTELFNQRKTLVNDFKTNRDEMEKLLAEIAERKSLNEQRSLVIDGTKISPEELMIEIEHNRKKSEAILEQIKLIKTKLNCYSLNIKSSGEEIESIEKEIIESRIQISIARQKNLNAIEKRNCAEKCDESLMNQDDGIHQMPPPLKECFPSWMRVSNSKMKRIDEAMSHLAETENEAKEYSSSYLNHINSQINTQTNIQEKKEDDESEIDKLAAEVLQIKKRRDALYEFIQKSRLSIENLLNSK